MLHNSFSGTFSKLYGSTFTPPCHVSSEDMTKDGTSFSHHRMAQITPTLGGMETSLFNSLASTEEWRNII